MCIARAGRRRAPNGGFERPPGARTEKICGVPRSTESARKCAGPLFHGVEYHNPEAAWSGRSDECAGTENVAGAPKRPAFHPLARTVPPLVRRRTTLLSPRLSDSSMASISAQVLPHVLVYLATCAVKTPISALTAPCTTPSRAPLLTSVCGSNPTWHVWEQAIFTAYRKLQQPGSALFLKVRAWASACVACVFPPCQG